MDKSKVDQKKSQKVTLDVSEYIRLYTEANYPIRDIAKHQSPPYTTQWSPQDLKNLDRATHALVIQECRWSNRRSPYTNQD